MMGSVPKEVTEPMLGGGIGAKRGARPQSPTLPG